MGEFLAEVVEIKIKNMVDSDDSTKNWQDPTLASSPQLTDNLQQQQFTESSNSLSSGDTNIEVNIPESAISNVDDPYEFGNIVGGEIANVLEGQLQRRGG